MEETALNITSQDLIARIHLSCAGGQLNEAYELIECLEAMDSYPSSAMDEMKVTMLKGIVMLKRGEYKAAEDSLLRSLALANNFGDTRLRYNRYDNLVALYTSTNQIHHAIDYLKKSLELKESDGSQEALVRSLLQMASLLFSIEDFADGGDALAKANVLISQLDNMELRMQYHFLYATQLNGEKRYEDALFQFEQIISYALKVNDTFLVSQTYSNQGKVLKEMERWDEAEAIFTKSLKIAQDNQLGARELLICVQLATIALKQNNPARCRELYDYVTNHKDLTEDDTLLEELAEVGASLYEAEGDQTKAIQAYRRYMQYYKSHYDNEQSRTVLYIKARYENEKREKELRQVKLNQLESEMKVLIAERTLRGKENLFKAVIENSKDMILILDQDMGLSYASPCVLTVSGRSEEELADKDIYYLIHLDDATDIMSKMRSALENPGLTIHAQFRLPLRDGGSRWMEGTFINLLADEVVGGIVCNFRDITERKQSEDAIQELNHSLEQKVAGRTVELQEAIKDLEAFSFSISHDLRAPLRIITGYAQLLLSEHESDLDEEARMFVNTIIENSHRMGQLIDALLNFSRMGRKGVHKSNTNIAMIVANAITELKHSNAAVIPHEFIIHELAPAYCDHALIKQVWLNLISNAIKYSSKKSRPVVEIGCTERFNETVYYVRDNGAGFDMKHAKSLFGVFKRLHDKADFDGIGVGLALAQRIIRMHDCRIWFEAEIQKGATFYFTLPPQENEAVQSF